MRYSIDQITTAIFVVILSVLIIDCYQNLDKTDQYCCCNIDKIDDDWVSNNLINDTLLDNSFCFYGNYSKYIIGFKGRVKLALSKFDYKFLAIKINSFFSNNFFCKHIREDFNILPYNFWEEKCYSFVA